MQCATCDAEGETRCADCARSLCDTHVVRRDGVGAWVFGPFFDDRKPRCGDCAGRRFWRAYLAVVVLLGALFAAFALAAGRAASATLGAGLTAVGAAFCEWRARAHARGVSPRSGSPPR